ncbi:hypothetical protein HPB52_012953 [Rhipicephalus sanguineus]|uniref:CCHC-type domain-containing protein n=1 Tax=Rhipicephalus sanguineus TaxID=34632 RepID=A0A9D4PLI8_RHISA|nr:hypothetical protein HPB52_012953 [Rhipicephalus sanguineus]
MMQPSQPASAPKRSAKRMADSQMDADGLSASETPASKRECPPPAASASPGSESKYKVVVKPPDVDRLTELRTLPATADSTVQVQAYLSSGSDLRGYVVSGVDPGESRESLVDAFTCSTHKVVTARYMGRGRTCLVTFQGPRMPPSRITYYGCILQFHVYKPGVAHCYRCFRTGHMRASCPQSTDASMESAETPTYKCGLCQTDDHDITSKDYPVKQKAIKARRQRRGRERSATQEERDADIPTSNRTVLKRGKKRAQQATSTPELTDTTADDLVKLDQQIAQLQMEVKRLTQRRRVTTSQADPGGAPPLCGPATTRAVKCVAGQPPTATMTAPSKGKRHHCVLQWNCRGLANKGGEIRHRLALGKLPAWCLLLQETNSLPRVPGFTGYASPTIPDRRCTNALGPPGKAAVYVATSYPQTQVPLLSWCNEWQEVVAVLVRLPRTDVIVVSVYVRPYSGSAPRLRIASLAHLRRTHPGCPVLVGGDFSAPHQSWGYPTSSARGSIVLDTFTDAHFVLLNATATSTQPDCWGSDHHPLIIGLAANSQRRLRRRCYITDWDLFRKELDALIAAPSSDPLQVLSTAVQAATQSNWQHALQSALDKASDWSARIGLTLSATKTAFMSITKRRGRRRLLQTPICLSLNGQALSTVSTIRVLGVELDASGCASAWPAAPLPEIPPWLKAQASENRPLTRLRQSNRQVEQESVVTTIDDSLAVYVDAAIDSCVLHTSLVCPTLPETQHTCSYVTEAPFPSVLAELAAIRDGLTFMIPKVDCLSLNRLLVYTDSTQAVRELRKVISSLDIASDVHRLIYSCACPVRVLWTGQAHE